jgi:tetraacyldisaccharide-1-P 4'-kinase
MIKSISALAKKTNSQIITTEKDAVKISLFKEYFLENNISIYVLPIRFKIITNQDKLNRRINAIF